MKRISQWLILVLFVGILQPFAVANTSADGSGTTVTKNPVADLNFSYPWNADPGSVQNGERIDDIDLYIGHLKQDGLDTIERSVLKFDLGSVPGKITQAILKLKTREQVFQPNQYIEIWGSNNVNWDENSQSLPEYDKTKSPDNYVRLNPENTLGDNSKPQTADITEIVKKFRANGYVTLILTGNESDPVSTRISAYASENNDSTVPILEVTYAANEPPTGTISINSGVTLTNSLHVNLDLSGTDPDGDPLKMRFSNDNQSWSDWEEFSSTKSWTLAAGDGTKTVYMQLSDGTETVSFSDDIILDTTPPTVSGVANDAVYRTDQTATFAEGTATLNGSVYTSGSLITREGRNTLVVTDPAGNTTTLNFIIDKTGPTGTISINNGAAATKSATVSLAITASDPGGGGSSGLDKMRFSQDGETWSSPEIYSTTKSYTLTDGDGAKTVYAQFTDKAGNISGIVSDTIMLDTLAPTVQGVTEGGIYNTAPKATFDEGTASAKLDDQNYLSGTPISTDGPHKLVVTDEAGNAATINFFVDTVKPTGTIVINAGEVYTRNSKVTLTLTGNDPGAPNASGVKQVRFSADGNSWSTPEPYQSTREYSLTGGDGSKKVYVQFIDAAGNISEAVSDDIILDTTPPTVTGVSDQAFYNKYPTISFEEGTGTLDGQPFTSGTEVSAEGKHVLNVKDTAGNSTIITFTIDTKPPVISGVEDGKSYNSDLTITFDEGAALLNNEPFTKGSTIQKEGSYTLVVTDEAGNKATVKFTLDKTPPTGSIVINGGAAYTGSKEVTLTLSSEDNIGTIQMQLSHDGQTWGSEENYTTSKTWTLADTNYGTKAVYVRFKDQAGNVSESYQDTIELVQALSTKEDTVLNFRAKDFNFDSLKKIQVVNLPEHGVLKLSGTAVKAGQEIAAEDLTSLTFVPDADWYGSTTFNWKASGGGAYDPTIRNIIIEVTAVNDAPVAKNLQFKATGGTEYSGTLSASDIDGDSLTYEIVKPPAKGKLTLTDASKGTFKLTFTADDYGSYTFTYRVTDGKDYSNEASVTIEVSPVPSSGGGSSGGGGNGSSGGNGNGSGGSGSGSGSTPPVVSNQDILINGVSLGQMAAAEVKSENGKQITQVTLDETKLRAHLDKEKDGVIMTIPVKNNSDSVVSLLNARLYNMLNAKHGTLVIQTETATYTLPADRIHPETVADKFGPDAQLQDIQIRIEVTKLPKDTIKVVHVGIGQIILISPGVEFTIKAVYKGKEIAIDRFPGYVERIIALPEGAMPARFSTGVVISTQGKLTHVPTKIIKKDGRYYAVINSMSNSLYAVISHKATFTDISSHWARAGIENMASRLILQGTNGTKFLPDHSITRAEFTAVIVRALGLKPADKPAAFKDVSSKDWFQEAVSTAVNEGLVQGDPNNAFHPNSNITREEAMTILAKAMKLVHMDTSVSDTQVEEQLKLFGDKDLISNWAKSAAALTILHGMMKGDAGKLNPGQNMTRAEAAVIMERFLQAAGLINSMSDQ
ncbi:S-layer homology domain-containing protein [Paenibacillus sp. J22TS3]|uniref:S-layer homology domain-containing protein n=1 Tax=Paenibacillus sp. J22TS3 TaxID=2807192 RepID=UPI001AFF29EF|nr:S-layer homology domain-containing protein [Paenibacillus sp. J22TS3]GIP23435.1 hypothetical protein J22TS3_37100 [Paenibacillus sp. J22TS3]